MLILKRVALLFAFLLAPLLPSCADHSGTNPARVAKNPNGPGDDGNLFKPSPSPVAPTEPPGGGGTPIGGGGGGSGTGGGGGNGGGSPPGGGPVPEPTTMLLVGSGLAAAAYLRKRATARKQA